MTFWVLVFWIEGAALSFALGREERQYAPGVYLAGLTVAVIMMMVAGWSAMGLGMAMGGGGPMAGVGGALVGVFLLGVGVLLNAPFCSRAMGELVMAAADESTGRTGPPVKPTHDKAVAAMRAKDPIRAANLLNEAIELDPSDLEARRLRAEVHYSCGETARAVAQLTAAYAIATESGTKGSLGLRAAELELSQRGEGTRAPKEKARAWLTRVRTDLAGTPFEGYAIERLRALD